MDLDRLEHTTLRDSEGTEHRLGDVWADQPTIVVFLRHFGCHLCREHATILRDRYAEAQERGAEIVAIGTGSVRYAEAFKKDEQVPFLVLVDDDAEAANAAAVKSVTPFGLFSPRSWPGAWTARKNGHKVHKAGKRVTQLGATFVMGEGSQVRFEHVDQHTADHADLEQVFAALPERVA
jgi:peroxiredoxin